MLDFSVSEIALIGVVALVAIGPERLPKVARAAGILFGRFRRYALSVKAEIDRELEQNELRELRKRMNEAVLEAERQVAASAQATDRVLNAPVVPAVPGPAVPGPAVVEPAVVAAAPAGAEPAQGELAFASPLDAALASTPVSTVPEMPAPFGGDPFSVRPSAPLRSKPMQAPAAGAEAT